MNRATLYFPRKVTLLWHDDQERHTVYSNKYRAHFSLNHHTAFFRLLVIFDFAVENKKFSKYLVHSANLGKLFSNQVNKQPWFAGKFFLTPHFWSVLLENPRVSRNDSKEGKSGNQPQNGTVTYNGNAFAIDLAFPLNE